MADYGLRIKPARTYQDPYNNDQPNRGGSETYRPKLRGKFGSGYAADTGYGSTPAPSAGLTPPTQSPAANMARYRLGQQNIGSYASMGQDGGAGARAAADSVLSGGSTGVNRPFVSPSQQRLLAGRGLPGAEPINNRGLGQFEPSGIVRGPAENGPFPQTLGSVSGLGGAQPRDLDKLMGGYNAKARYDERKRAGSADSKMSLATRTAIKQQLLQAQLSTHLSHREKLAAALSEAALEHAGGKSAAKDKLGRLQALLAEHDIAGNSLFGPRPRAGRLQPSVNPSSGMASIPDSLQQPGLLSTLADSVNKAYPPKKTPNVNMGVYSNPQGRFGGY